MEPDGAAPRPSQARTAEQQPVVHLPYEEHRRRMMSYIVGHVITPVPVGAATLEQANLHLQQLAQPRAPRASQGGNNNSVGAGLPSSASVSGGEVAGFDGVDSNGGVRSNSNVMLKPLPVSVGREEDEDACQSTASNTLQPDTRGRRRRGQTVMSLETLPSCQGGMGSTLSGWGQPPSTTMGTLGSLLQGQPADDFDNGPLTTCGQLLPTYEEDEGPMTSLDCGAGGLGEVYAVTRFAQQ